MSHIWFLSRKTVLTACRRWLRPIAKWLLRSGVTWKEFAELSRSVFVLTASEEFGIRGRPTNVSRVALLTGLSRRDVRRVQGEGHLVALARRRGIAEPRQPRAGPAGTSTPTSWRRTDGRACCPPTRRALLLRSCCVATPATSLDRAGQELVKSGSVERQEDGSYRALRRYYMPRAMDGRAVERSGSVLADLATTIEHNLSRRAGRALRIRGRAQSRRIDPRHLPAFRAFVEREAQSMLERVDDWLQHSRGADRGSGAAASASACTRYTTRTTGEAG